MYTEVFATAAELVY